jgi:hypothetical protein
MALAANPSRSFGPRADVDESAGNVLFDQRTKLLNSVQFRRSIVMVRFERDVTQVTE